MTDKRLKLMLPSKPESLEAVRKELQDFVQGTPYEEKAYDILLVVSEAGTNVVRHAYGGKNHKKMIILDCVLKPDYLTIMVCDKGKGLSRAQKHAMFTEEGGFGLYLMKELTDKFKCHTSRFGTIVELGFKNGESDASESAADIPALKWPSSVWSQMLDVFAHPTKNLVLYSEFMNNTTFTAAGRAKSYSRLRLLAYLMRSRVGEIQQHIEQDEYDTAKTSIGDLNRQIRNANQDFCNISPKGKHVLRAHFASAFDILTRLEGELLASEQSSLEDNSSGIYDLIRKREIINLLSETTSELHKGLDDQTGCWIALDDGPLQLI